MERRKTFIVLTLSSLCVSVPIVVDTQSDGSRGIEPLKYQIVGEFPHDPRAFTQGLFFDEGLLYESTGLYGRSTLRRVRFETGEVLNQIAVPEQYFAEGIALLSAGVVQVTWRSQRGFVYEKQSLRRVRTFEYSGEGWGLASDRERLVMSDGSPMLRFMRADTMSVESTVTVTEAGVPLVNLNELEFARGKLLANVWPTDRIVQIDPGTGEVLASLELAGLRPSDARKNRDATLNGIAYDPQTDRLFVTGKLWRSLFILRVQWKA